MNVYVIGTRNKTLVSSAYHISGVILDDGGQNYDTRVVFVCENAPVARDDHPYLSEEYGHAGKSARVTAYCKECKKETMYKVLDVATLGEPPMICRYCGGTPAFDENGWVDQGYRWRNTDAGWVCPACA